MYISQNQRDWPDFIPVALFAYRVSVQETTLLSPFEVVYGRKPRLPSNLELARNADESLVDFKKNWEYAYERIGKVGRKSKEKFDAKYKPKIINIADNVRLFSPATKVGLKAKLRGDLWAGPFKVIGKLANGNVKLNVNKKNPYIVKLAETVFDEFPP